MFSDGRKTLAATFTLVSRILLSWGILVSLRVELYTDWSGFTTSRPLTAPRFPLALEIAGSDESLGDIWAGHGEPHERPWRGLIAL